MFYNYKSNDVMQDVIIKCACPIVNDIEDEYEKLRRYEHLAIYAPSYIAKEILGGIFEYIDDLWVNEESNNMLLFDDEKDVVITIAYDGMVFVESARFKSGDIKYSGAMLSYVYDSFTKKEVDVISSDETPVLVFGFAEDCDCCCDDDSDLVEYSENKDGDMHGFTASKSDNNRYYSCSFYSSEKLDKNDIQKMLKDMGF